MVDNYESMPLYQSHKRVWALKIKRVTLLPGETITGPPIAHVFFEDESFPPILVNLFGKPTPHAGWFYVIYDPANAGELPYESFSPTEAFEKGYSRVEFLG